MTTLLHKLFLAFILLITVSFSAFTQESEAEIKEKAFKLFEDEKFVEATPLYLRLIALSPRSTDYNFRYGTCLLFNSYKKQDAFKYLNYAVTDAAIDVEAFYFLGKAYHLNYQFNEAIKNYELYKQKSNGKPKASFQIDRQIEMCLNGKRLLTTITDLIVLEKKEIEISNFFRLYDLRNIGGDILVAADFQTKIDKKKNHTPLIHFPARTTSVFYASYGDVDTGQKDIYTRKKLPDGTWSLPQLVPGNVNSAFDEDFPYLHPDGQYLYFSSKGHSSMGGYDIFRSKFDAENNSYGIPENMDFAISSPDNDLFYVADSIEQNAYFASSRQSTNGKMYVYKVRVERVPIQLAVVKGDFASTINPANKKISITVTDFASGEKIGVFNSTEKGKYLITFPKGGKYQYEMKVDGSSVIHKSVVSIPFLKEFKPLKQKIREELDGANEIVKITDLFNEEVEDPQSVIAEVIKMRSELNVNVQSFDLKELEAKKANQQILADLGLANAGPAEIVTKFDQIASNQKSVLQAKENLRNGSLTSALKALEEADALQKEAKMFVATATSASSDEKKLTEIKKAQAKMTEANSKKEIAKELVQFSDSVAKLIPSEQEKATELKQLSEDVRNAVANENFTQLKELVSLKATTIKSSQTSASNNPIDALLGSKSEVQKQTKQLEKQIATYKETEKSLGTEIASLQTELVAAKKKDQPAIQSRLDAKVAENDAVSQEIARLDKKIAVLSKEEKALNDRISFVQSISQTTSDSKVIAPNEVQAKLDEVDTKNNRTLENYINQQAIDLEKKTGSTIANNGNANSKEVELVALKTDFVKQQNAVDSQSDLTAEDKITAKSKNEQDYLLQLEKQLNSIDQALVSDPSNTNLQNRKVEVQAEKTKTQASYNDHQSELKTLQTQSAVVPETTEQTLAQLVPDYKEQQSKAKSSDSKKQLENMNAIDLKVISKADAALLILEKDLASNPSDSKKLAEQKALENLKVATTNQIQTRNSALERLTETTAETTTSPAKELEKINSNYESQQAEALKLSDQTAQLNQANAIDEALVVQINEAIKKTETELVKNPNSGSLKSKISALNELKSTTDSKIANRKKELNAIQNQPVESAVSSESELKTISPNYSEQQAAAAKAPTKEEQLKRANAVDQVLAAKVNSALKVVENGLIANPTNANLIARKNALNELKTKTENQIIERDLALKTESAISSTSNTSPASELALLVPNYNEQQATALKTDDKELQLKQGNAVDETVLSKVNTALSETEVELQKKPNNETLLAKKSALNQLKTTTENQIEQRNIELLKVQSETTLSETITAEKELTKIAPDYAIQQQKAQESGDRATQIKASNSIDESVVGSIDKQLKTINSELVSTPSAPNLIAEKKALDELKATITAQIGTRNNELATLNASQSNNTKDPLVDSVKDQIRLKHTENVAKIETSNQPENEKEVSLLKENQAYLNDIEKALVKSNATLAKNPTDEKALAENTQLKNEQAIQEAKVFEKREELIAKEQSKLNIETIEAKIDSKFKPTTEAEIAALSEEQKTSKIKEEELFQKKLEQTKLGNDKKLNASFDPKLAAENKLIETAKDNSTARVEQLKSSTNVNGSNANTSNSTAAIEKEAKANITADLGEKESFLMTEKPSNKEMAQEQLNGLNLYVVTIDQKIDELQAKPSENASAIEVKSNQKVLVKNRIASIEFEIEQLNKLANSNPQSNLNSSEEFTQMKSLKSEQVELNSKMETTKSASERKTIQKQLIENKEKQMNLELASNEKIVNELEQNRDLKTSSLKQQEPNNSLVQQVVARIETKTGVKEDVEKPKSQSLTSDILAEQKSISLINTTRSIIEIQQEEKKSGLQIATADQLKINKRRYVIEIGEIEREMSQLPVGKESEAKRTQLSAVKSELEVAVKDLDRMILKEEQRELAQVNQLQLNTTPVTDVEEQKIVTSAVYKELVKENESVQQVVNQQKEIEISISQKRNEIAQSSNKDQQKVDELKELLRESDQLTEEKNRIVESIETRAQSNNLNPKQVNNLLVRGVLPREPIAEVVIKSGISPIEIEKLTINEMPEGLFFTVQIGAFSQEVKPLHFNKFKPLTAKKQPNGQVRYSTGFYKSVEEARPKKAEVIAGGISDAFITAYFNGERITIEEANKIAAKANETVQNNASTEKQGVVKYASFESEESIPERFVQLSSQQKFEEYPKVLISNLHGISNFYYDSVDQKVKSQFYTNQSALPTLQAVAFNFDTVEVNRLEQQFIEQGTSLISVQFKGTELSGDVSNWLLRLSIPYCGIPKKDGVQLLFPVVKNEQKQQLMIELKQFKYTEYTEIQNR